MPEIFFKTCSTCYISQPLDAFTKDSHAKDGKQFECRTCTRLRRENDLLLRGEEIRARDRLSHAKKMQKKRQQVFLFLLMNLDVILEIVQERMRLADEARRQKKSATDKAYRKNNPEKIKAKKQSPKAKATKAAHRAQHLEEHHAYMRAYNAANRHKHINYHKTHPEVKRASEERRRAKKRGDTLRDLSAAQVVELMQAAKYRCAYCDKKFPASKLTLDHITPLGPDGPTTLHNIVIACRPCNSRKQTGPPLKPVQPLLLTLAPAKKPKVLLPDALHVVHFVQCYWMLHAGSLLCRGVLLPVESAMLVPVGSLSLLP